MSPDPLQYATVALSLGRARVRWPSLHSSSCQLISRGTWRGQSQRPSLSPRRYGAEVHLLEVVSPRGASFLGDAHAQGGSKGNRSRLEHAIKAAAHAPIAVRTVSHRGDAATIIPSYMQLVKARLLVIGQHYGTPRWRRNARIVGTLCRAAPGPVLVLPPGVTAKTTARAFGHILSAVDFTVASAVAVRTTIGLIRQTGARLTLVHALKNAPHRAVFSGAEAARVARNLRGQAAHMAERLRRKTPADVRIRVDARVTTGDPHHGILAVASDVKADLIVMGVPPRSRLDEVLFGSTLRNVLRRHEDPCARIAGARGRVQVAQRERRRVGGVASACRGRAAKQVAAAHRVVGSRSIRGDAVVDCDRSTRPHPSGIQRIHQHESKSADKFDRERARSR